MKKTYLDLSTGHLSRDTQNLLEGLAMLGQSDWPAGDTQGWPTLSLGAYRCGWFITVPAQELHEVREQMYALPQDLRCLLLHAFAEGAELIRFDADGYVDGDLPYFQEI